jgi:hypothetical protein
VLRARLWQSKGQKIEKETMQILKSSHRGVVLVLHPARGDADASGRAPRARRELRRPGGDACAGRGAAVAPEKQQAFHRGPGTQRAAQSPRKSRTARSAAPPRCRGPSRAARCGVPCACATSSRASRGEQPRRCRASRSTRPAAGPCRRASGIAPKRPRLNRESLTAPVLPQERHVLRRVRPKAVPHLRR